MAVPQTQLFEDEVPLIRSCPALNEIRLAEEIKDLTLEVKDGVRLQVHRIILAARIPSLRADLRGCLTEKAAVLRWPTVPPCLATSLITYVYTGQVEVTQANVRGMIAFAKMLNLTNLEKWGTNFMAKRVNSENLATTWAFARSFKIGSLMETCINLMQAQFKCFVRSDLFVRLPTETVLLLIRNDNLPVDSEEEVVAAISCWVGPGTKEVNERLKLHAPTMLKEVRWLQTSAQYRSGLAKSHEMFRSNDCARLLGEVEQWIKIEDEEKPPCPFNRRRRPPSTLFVFGMDRNSKKWSVLGFDRNLQAEEWIADMEDRGLASYSVVGESIFVVGGQNYSTNVIEFLVRERLWRKRTSLAVGRGKHAAAVVKFNAAAADEEGGEKALISIVGGTNDSTSLSSCEVYDVSQDRWYKLPDLPERRGGPAAASLPGDSRVFVFGGCNGSRWLDSVVCCQLRADWREKAAIASSTDFWQSVARMRTARRGLAATHFRGKILVAGGWNEQGALSIVELFSPPDAACPRGQWTELAAMREPRWYFTLLTSADAVFALGSSSGSENTVEVFTAPKGSLGFGNGLISWTWLSRHPVETLSRIAGAASIRM